MKREAKILLGKAVDSLIVSIDCFNRPWDKGRIEAVLIMLDHAFEMLLKAAIIHRGGKIREKRAKQTIGFDTCVRKALSDGEIRLITEEQALILQTINSLRDAVQHHYLDISEDHLYLHAQSGLTLFRDLFKSVFNHNLANELPDRILPITIRVPTDLIILFKQQIEEVRKLLSPGKRRRAQALGKLRSLTIVENALSGQKFQPDEFDLRQIERRIRSGESWDAIFPSVASINIVTEGEGPSLSIRITKKEGIPVQLVPEGTPDAGVVAVKRVNELDFYNLSCSQLAEHVNLSVPRTVAIIWYLELKGNPEFHKEIQIGKAKFDRYSQKALQKIKGTLADTKMEDIWGKYQRSKKTRR